MDRKEEANKLCRYLSGKDASTVLADRYEHALIAIGDSADIDIRRINSLSARESGNKDEKDRLRQRLIVMCALLESDPEYFNLFRNHDNRFIATIHAIWSGIRGIINRMF